MYWENTFHMGIHLYRLELKPMTGNADCFHTTAMKTIRRWWAPIAVGYKSLLDGKHKMKGGAGAGGGQLVTQTYYLSSDAWSGKAQGTSLHLPQPPKKDKKKSLQMTSPLLPSHPLLFLLLPLKRPPLTQQREEDPLFSSFFPHTCHCSCLQKGLSDGEIAAFHLSSPLHGLLWSCN